MNIRDSYKHGADGLGVVKNIFFATAEDVASDSSLHVNDLVFLRADTFETKVPLPIPTLNLNTTGSAGSLLVVKRETNANHYLTFVDSNNATATAENFYTDGELYYNPSTNAFSAAGIIARTSFNYSGIETGSTNSARCVWFAHSDRNGTPCINTSFKYNPSTNVLTVGAISGACVWIGDTQLLLNSTGTTNKLTPDTSISNTSTHGTIPSSKAVYEAIINGIASNDAMIFKGFLTGGADVDHTRYTPGADRGDTYKVSTAGWINGEYYQVNDTFICTTDETVAATSSNVSTIKTNWGVVEGNGDYLNIHGGTMYGTLSWDGTTALPTVTTASNILVVDSNITKQIPIANLLTQLSADLYWADQTLSTTSSNNTTPRFAKVGIGGAKDSTAKLKVYGNEIVTGNLTIGGCTLVYESSCLKFTF